jgi:hypothetical protein
MSLKQRIQEDLKDALRSGDTQRRSTLRLLLAAIKNAEIEAGAELDDADVLMIIRKQARQRRDAASEFARVGRSDRADEELAEQAILTSYLPPQLSEEEITQLAANVIAEVGAQGPKDVGKVMKQLMPQVKGKADGAQVNRVVRELLAQSGGA